MADNIKDCYKWRKGDPVYNDSQMHLNTSVGLDRRWIIWILKQKGLPVHLVRACFLNGPYHERLMLGHLYVNVYI
jgi:hypothetical protein